MPRVRQFAASEAGAAEVSERLQGQRATVTDVFGKKGQQLLQQVPVSPVAREALDVYGELIGEITRHMKGQDKRLTALARADQRVHWLATIPGIGPYSAMILLAEIGEIRRFATAKALFSYAGLVPWVRKSAGHSHRGPISRCGSPGLRWVMVEAAHTALRCSPAAGCGVRHVATEFVLTNRSLRRCKEISASPASFLRPGAPCSEWGDGDSDKPYVP